jgi:hypothetical protein
MKLLAPVDDEAIARIAERASADERSVMRRLVGLPVRGKCGRRVDDAIRKENASSEEARRK